MGCLGVTRGCKPARGQRIGGMDGSPHGGRPHQVECRSWLDVLSCGGNDVGVGGDAPAEGGQSKQPVNTPQQDYTSLSGTRVRPQNLC